MLEKTMKKVLTRQINKWLATITDDDVREAAAKDLIVTGGCFTSMILNEDVNDIDCYFRTKGTVVKVAEYYANVWNESRGEQRNAIDKITKVFVLDGASPSQEILDYYGVKDLKDSPAVMVSNCAPERVKIIFPSDGIVGRQDEEGDTLDPLSMVEEVDEVKVDEVEEAEPRDYVPVFMSTNAITLSRGVQIVVRFYGEPDEIHDTYDFEHCKAFYDHGKRVLSIPNGVYEATINKTLIYTGSRYPVCSVFRLRKFIGRGWHINAGQILKMCMQISAIDLLDIDVLEDQLIGVDSLYFMQLIEQFRKKQSEDDGFTLTAPYLLSVIDKIF